MNIITASAENVLRLLQEKLIHYEGSAYTAYLLSLFSDLSWLTFNNYFIDGKADNKVAFCQFYIEIIDRNDLPIEMDDLKTDKVIRFVNFFEKKDPAINLNDLNGHTGPIDLTETFCVLDLFVAPQIIEVDGNIAIDLYTQPAEHSREFFEKFSTEQMIRRGLLPLVLLDYVEKRLKKERKTIYKKLPSKELQEKIAKEGKRYESQPVRIRDISVRYLYEPHEARKYNRYCEAWGVRGHYRHYKNGRTVYIKPYKKGKGQMKNTEYNIKEDNK